MDKRQAFIDLARAGGSRQDFIDLAASYGVHDPFEPLMIYDMLMSGALPSELKHGGIASLAHGGRTGFKKGTKRDRLQKDYESLTSGADWMRTAPPKWWLFPEKYGMNRDDAMTFFKERFMYGDLDPIPTPLEAFKKSPELVKFKEWWGNRKAKGGLARILNLS